MHADIEVKAAVEAVSVAMGLCRRVQAAVTDEVLEKQDRSPVTIADFASQAIICRALGESFPDDPVIGEEDSAELRTPEQAGFLERIQNELAQTGIEGSRDEICGWIDRGGAQDYSPRFWTLDPIDGTKGFLRGGQYAVSLALIVEGQLEIGILGCPNFPHADVPALTGDGTGVIFIARRGAGTFAATEQDSKSSHPIRVTETNDTASLQVCESVESGHSSHGHAEEIAKRMGITKTPVRMDSQAKYAAVAAGAADVYLRLPTRIGYRECIWDHAGGVLVVEEAGGRVTDIHGRPLDFTRGSRLTQNEGVVVTNGQVHDEVIHTIKSVLS